MPADDLLDQFLAEPSGQRTRAKQEAVIDRAKDGAVQQVRFGIGPQLACILASLQVANGGSPSGTNPSVEERLTDGRLALALGDQPIRLTRRRRDPSAVRTVATVAETLPTSTESSIPSFSALTRNGKPALFAY